MTSSSSPRRLSDWIALLSESPLVLDAAGREKALRTVLNEGSSLREMGERLLDVPPVALAILRQANVSSRGLEPALHLEAALTRVGLRQAEQVVRRMPVQPASAVAYQQMLQISRHAAQQAAGLFGGRLARLRPELLSAALLSLAPLWALALQHPALLARWWQRVWGDGESAQRVEQDLFGCHLLALCQGLVQLWRLPEWIVRGYELLGAPRTLMRVRQWVGHSDLAAEAGLQAFRHPQHAPMLANALAWHALGGWDTRQTRRWQRLTAIYLDQEVDELCVRSHELSVISANQGVATEVWHPAQMLIWPTGAKCWVASQPEAVPRAAPQVDKMRWQLACRHLMQSPSPFSTPQALLQGIVEALCGLGFERTLLLLSNRDQSLLKAQYAWGLAGDAGHLVLDVKQSVLLRQFLQKPLYLHLTPDNSARYAAHIPGVLKAFWSGSEQVWQSFAVRGRVALLMVADCGGSAMNDQWLTGFAKTRVYIERALAQFFER